MKTATATDYWGDQIKAEKDIDTQQIILKTIPRREKFDSRELLICLSVGKAKRFFKSGLQICQELEENK